MSSFRSRFAWLYRSGGALETKGTGAVGRYFLPGLSDQQRRIMLPISPRFG
jgi:hypothetical protein